MERSKMGVMDHAVHGIGIMVHQWVLQYLIWHKQDEMENTQ